MITKSNKVFIKRKPITTAFYRKNEESMGEGNWKIGASIKNNDVCRGLTFDEEEKYLPSLIGVQSKNDNWQKATTNYWNNISKTVPKDGIELEIGFNYKDEEDGTKEADNASKGESCKEEDKWKYGFPINIIDYILYRYCLVYSHVSNDVANVSKSHNIRFYLHSKKEETKTNHDTLTLKNKAYGKYLEVLSNREKVENLLRLLTDKNGSSLYQIGQSNDEQDILLQNAMLEKPTLFITYYDDKVLEMKSFISKCISEQRLKRVPNTETIMYGDNTIIGHTIEEAVVYLQNDKNSQVLNTLKIQTGMVKAKGLVEEIVNPVLPPKVAVK